MSQPYRIPGMSAAEALDAHAAGRLDLVDLRKAPARAADGRALRGAPWIDPFTLDHAHALTRTARPVAVFCVHGHEVSQFGCALLRLHGREAVYVTGGFAALAEAGAPVFPLQCPSQEATA